jgi:L-malate glycosyltransferase
MHILQIPSWYPTEKEPFSGNFVKRHIELIATNHQVTVLNFVAEKRNEIIQVENKISENHTEIQIFYPKKKNKFIQLFYLRKAFKRVAKNIKNVDLIHGHVILERGILFLWAKNYFQKPLVISEHASYYFKENYQRLNLFQKLIIIQNIKKCNKFSCVSVVLAEEIKYLFPKRKIEIIPNVINRELFKISEKKENQVVEFIHISTLEKVKNVSKIIKAFELFHERNHDFKLTIIAEKRNFEIEKQIKNSNISSKTELKGPIEIEDVAKELKKSDALVMFSDLETFSCVIAEAWSCGIPVISSAVGIAKKMTPDLGILVSNLEIDDLAKALEEFYTSKNQYDSELIRSKTEKFDCINVLKDFDEVYKF